MTGSANFTVNRAKVAFPVTAGSAMHTGFPITISRAMTTAAQSRAVHQFYLMPIASLEEFQVRFIVAIEAVIVSLMTTMSHDQIAVFFCQNHIALRVEFELQGFVLFMAGVAIEARCIPSRTNQFTRGQPRGRSVGEAWINQGDALSGRESAPQIRGKRDCKSQKQKGQACQNPGSFGIALHFKDLLFERSGVCHERFDLVVCQFAGKGFHAVFATLILQALFDLLFRLVIGEGSLVGRIG